MVFRFCERLSQSILIFLFICTQALHANLKQEDLKNEKQIEVALRQIGHEVLMSLGDCDSRVLPIKKVAHKYQISFEREFGIDPGDIATTFDQVIKEYQIADSYLVEVEHCESNQIVHSFELGNLSSNQIACQGRLLPSDCYTLNMTIWDDILSSDAQIKGPIPSHSVESLIHIFTLICFGSAFLLSLGFIFKWFKNRNSIVDNPQMISIGASKFDKKHQSLSFENKKVELSNKETELLSLLHASANEPIEREVILKKVWGDDGDYVGRTVDVFISKLRRKLEADSSIRIVNIRGVGYKLMFD